MPARNLKGSIMLKRGVVIKKSRKRFRLTLKLEVVALRKRSKPNLEVVAVKP